MTTKKIQEKACRTISPLLVLTGLLGLSACSHRKELTAEEKAYIKTLEERVNYLTERETSIKQRVELAWKITKLAMTNSNTALSQYSGPAWSEAERLEKEMDAIAKERYETELRKVEFQQRVALRGR